MPVLCADVLSSHCVLMRERSLGLCDASESLYDDVFLLAEIAKRLARGELTLGISLGQRACGSLGDPSSARLSLICVLKNVHLIVCWEGSVAWACESLYEYVFVVCRDRRTACERRIDAWNQYGSARMWVGR